MHHCFPRRSSEKQWCRSGNLNSCVVTDSEGTFSSTKVFIHDDRNSMFLVTIHQLEMRDSGWYWCRAGQQQVAVHVSVTAQTTTRMSHRDHSRHHKLHSYIISRNVSGVYLQIKRDLLKQVTDGTLLCCFGLIASLIFCINNLCSYCI